MDIAISYRPGREGVVSAHMRRAGTVVKVEVPNPMGGDDSGGGGIYVP